MSYSVTITAVKTSDALFSIGILYGFNQDLSPQIVSAEVSGLILVQDIVTFVLPSERNLICFPYVWAKELTNK